MSLAYDGERADAQVVDQLETILRHVADELATWRTRAQKAEAELKESGTRAGGGSGGGGGGGAVKLDPETRGRVLDLEQENKALRQRVEAARLRVHDLLSRLTFLEEQARETPGNGGARGGAGAAISAASAAGGGAGAGSGGASGSTAR